MEIDLDNTYNLMMKKMTKMILMMMKMMMKMIIAVTQSSFKLGPPIFSRK